MMAPALPRPWGGVQSLTWFLLVLTATPVAGVTEQCDKKRRCGYGARCDDDTGGCICLSEGDKLHVMERKGYRDSVVYCSGKGVTDCGNGLCGSGTECKGNICRCLSNKGIVRDLQDTSPYLKYCVETCSLSNNKCPVNTTCTDPLKEKQYRCNCPTTRSSTGQCLSKSATMTSAVPVTTERTRSMNDSRTLTIGLAAGIGGAIFLVAVVVIAVVLARRQKRHRCDDGGTASTGRQPQSPLQSRAGNSKAHETVVDTMPGPSDTHNPDDPTVTLLTEVSVITPSSKAGAYEDVARDFSVLHSTAKVTDNREQNGTDNLDDLYLNHAIPANKAQRRKQNNLQESSDSLVNQYNTLYELKPTNGKEDRLQPEMTGNENTDGGTYSMVGERGGDTQPAVSGHRDDVEYDELKLSRV